MIKGIPWVDKNPPNTPKASISTDRQSHVVFFLSLNIIRPPTKTSNPELANFLKEHDSSGYEPDVNNILKARY
jgi:hypothetical protein